MLKLRFSKIIVGVFLFCFSMFFWLPAVSATASELILVYEPYTLGADMAGLVRTADSFFDQTQNSIEFQPVAEVGQFLEMLPEADYVVMPPWVYRQVGDEYDIEPLLVSERNGQKEYNKFILSGANGPGTEDDLAGSEVGMMRLGDVTEAVLNESFFAGGDDAYQFNIIDVSKPVDAVMAASFGQVEAAIVNSISFDLISEEQPQLVDDLEIIAESEAFSRPGLYSMGGSDEERIIDIFMEMEGSSTGQELLSRFQIDGWVIKNDF